MRSIAALPVVVVTAIAVAAPGTSAQVPVPTPPVVTVSFQFARPGNVTVFRDIQLKYVLDGSTVVVRCLTKSGDRCGGKLRKAFTAENVSGTVAVKGFDGKRIKPGRRLEATISGPGRKTQYKTILVRKKRNPVITTECSEPGSSERGPC